VIETVDRRGRCCRSCRPRCPPSIDVHVLSDRNDDPRPVEDVQFELALSVALVVMVIFLFLRSLGHRVPSVAVPLSLVGTFGVQRASLTT
jgi:multidrug efflux pump